MGLVRQKIPTPYIIMKFFIVLLLIHYSLQQNQTVSVCEEECGDEGFCNAKCAYNDDLDVLCECTQIGDGVPVCLTPGGAECPDIPDPDVLDEPNCANLSDAVEAVLAYTFKMFLGRSKCTLLKHCYTESNNPNPTPIVNAKKKCATCAQLVYKYGPTTIHYDCGFGDFNPYVQVIPTDTTCSPTHSCADVDGSDTVVSTKDVYTCLYDAGVSIWQKTVGEEITEETPADVTCNCPELKVADEEGTKLSCTHPVEPAGGFYTLTEANTCGLICDGFYILELTCGFNKAGTVWKAEWDDGYTQDIEVTCLACLDEKTCNEGTTSAPASTTAAPASTPATTPATTPGTTPATTAAPASTATPARR